EVNLPGVSGDFASEVRQAVFNFNRQQQSVPQSLSSEHSPDVVDTASNGELVLQLANKEVAKYGLTNMMALVFVAALMPFVDDIGDLVKLYVIPEIQHVMTWLGIELQNGKTVAAIIL